MHVMGLLPVRGAKGAGTIVFSSLNQERARAVDHIPALTPAFLVTSSLQMPVQLPSASEN